jgi:uncharacterized protein YukE
MSKIPMSAITSNRALACLAAADRLDEIAAILRGMVLNCNGSSAVVSQDWGATSADQQAARINRGIHAAVAALVTHAKAMKEEEEEVRRNPCPKCMNAQRKHCPSCGACVTDTIARAWSDEMVHSLEATCTGDAHQHQLLGSRRRRVPVG